MDPQEIGYCDLSISKNFDLTQLQIIEKLGFNTVALNTYVEEVCEEPKKKKKKGAVREKQDYFPEPVPLPDDIKRNSKLNILQRVTIEISDASIALKINQSENIKKYDIIAVLPKTLQAFQYACGTMDVEIITFAPETRIPFKVSRKLYRQAAERGIFFELMYSAAIKDTTARKNIISTAHNYHAVGKSKNLILSSGAEQPAQVRGIHDVINLGFLLGVNSNEGIKLILNNPKQLINKAKGRRSGKLYMEVSAVSEVEDSSMVEE
ncbi:hypothetical protein JYU34_006678 [Plutella xylostella]|uniref:Uncharacterized protein n=1 Tax=Plutella xylostella TaxID=51655 RepID=A0ABQ7QSN6_PLUXY|nr:hypothetical protein JYU34_006678 [Plutella xylostella]